MTFLEKLISLATDFISLAPLSEHKQLFYTQAKVCGHIQYTHKHAHTNTQTHATSRFCIEVMLRANLIVSLIALVLCLFLAFGVWHFNVIGFWVSNLTINQKMCCSQWHYVLYKEKNPFLDITAIVCSAVRMHVCIHTQVWKLIFPYISTNNKIT